MGSGLGIELGASAIKAVRVRRTATGWKIVRACRVTDPAPPPPPPKPGRAQDLPARVLPDDLREMFGRSGISGACVLGLGGRDLIVKYVTAPPVPPWKLQMMMDLEIKGTSGADVCGDFAKLDIPGDLAREMVSLVAVAKTEYVGHQISLARKAGLSAEWCCPSAVGLFAAFLASGQYRPGETTAVLDIGRDNMDLVIQADGVLYFARGASGGARRFTDAVGGLLGLDYDRAERYKCGRAAIVDGGATDAEARVSGVLCEVADGLAAAVRSAAMFCKAQAKLNRLEIDRLVLSGGGALLPGLAAYLAKKLSVPTDLLDPASRMDVSGLPSDQLALFEGPASAEMSVALGLAMLAADEGLFRLEVVPDAVRARRRFTRGTSWAIAAGVVLAGALGLDIYDAGRKRDEAKAVNGQLTKCRDDLKRQMGDYRKRNDEVDLVDRRARMLASRAQRNVPVLGFVKLLRQVTPVGITLSGVTVAAPDAGSGGSADRVNVTVTGVASREALGEDEFAALDKYRQTLLDSSKSLAFAIEEPKIRTGDTVGPRGREFLLTACIYTLGVESEEAEEGPAEPVEDGAPVPVPTPVNPYGDDGIPVIIPRGVQSKPRPPGTYTPDEPGGGHEEGDTP